MEDFKNDFIGKNYTPGTMSFMDGFLGPKGDVGFMMDADFNKAKRIIDFKRSEGNAIKSAYMGLDGDWSVNSMEIFDGNNYFEYEMWGSSGWAAPILIIFYSDGSSEAYNVWSKSKK